MKARLLFTAVVTASLLAAPVAGAQPKNRPSADPKADDKTKDAPPPPSKDPSKDEKLVQAKAHYEAGLRLYDAEDYDAARVEFERAYALTPNYRILYNLGLILKYKTDYVGALKNFELYLEEGLDAPEARRNEVRKEIAAIKQLVATVTITTNVPDAEISVDEAIVGKSPLSKPVLVNPGRRRLHAQKKGRQAVSKAIDIASRDNVSVNLELGDERQVILIEKPGRRLPWVGFAITGALAVASAATGYVAINASSSLRDERAEVNASGSRLNLLSKRSKDFGYIADGTGLAAIVAGGISLFYTIKWWREDNRTMEKLPQPNNAPPKTTWVVLPGAAYGTF